ncbi:NYN domain-containing protein [Nostoc sp. CHAB 5715]|nr:NYN domain-containing protein [Nostoc sp. CHAB 5715]MCC5619748.1 NYN domain-containing protein [Nostoc sp. CHAB 5836]MCC5626471.1 NYN domain-containing protein [Nostoc sp. CHAB 5715]
MKTLIRTGQCAKPGCSTNSSNLVYRHEQKTVDTMLSCDLIHGGYAQYDVVVLVSGDDDFLPPLRTVLLQGTSAIRIHPKRNGTRTSFPQGGGKFFEVDL